jgi:hypothetical protein
VKKSSIILKFLSILACVLTFSPAFSPLLFFQIYVTFSFSSLFFESQSALMNQSAPEAVEVPPPPPSSSPSAPVPPTTASTLIINEREILAMSLVDLRKCLDELQVGWHPSNQKTVLRKKLTDFMATRLEVRRQVELAEQRQKAPLMPLPFFCPAAGDEWCLRVEQYPLLQPAIEDLSCNILHKPIYMEPSMFPRLQRALDGVKMLGESNLPEDARIKATAKSVEWKRERGLVEVIF